MFGTVFVFTINLNLYPATLDDAKNGFICYTSYLGGQEQTGLGVFEWQNGGLVCSWQGSNAGDWNFDSAGYYPLTIQGGQSVQFCFEPSTAIALLSVSSSQISCVYESSMAQPWNIYFIGNLPITPLTTYTGDQLAIYQYISLNVTPAAPGLSGLGDIHYEYDNLNDANSFSGWTSQIKDMVQVNRDPTPARLLLKASKALGANPTKLLITNGSLTWDQLFPVIHLESPQLDGELLYYGLRGSEEEKGHGSSLLVQRILLSCRLDMTEYKQELAANFYRCARAAHDAYSDMNKYPLRRWLYEEYSPTDLDPLKWMNMVTKSDPQSDHVNLRWSNQAGQSWGAD